MKIINKIALFSAFVLLAAACETDKDMLYSLDYITAPENVSAVFDITQDNTGLVSIVPNADGAQKFRIGFGDGSGTSEEVNPGEIVKHIYPEGVHTVTITAVGITGLTTEHEQEINVSFNPPENLNITIENDPVISQQVNLSATADYASLFDIYWGDTEDEEPTRAMPEEVVSHQYAEPGVYDITVEARGAAIATLDTTFSFEVTAILSPVNAAPEPPVRGAADVISIFSGAYSDVEGTDFNPNWGQSTVVSTVDIEGNTTLKYATLNYQGTQFADPIDASYMEYLHLNLWTADAEAVNIFTISPGPAEKAYALPITQGEWISYDIPLSEFSDVVDLTELIQFKFDGANGGTIFLDNIYFYRETSAPMQSAPAPPSRDPSEVVSVYSDAYTDVEGTNFNPYWWQTTLFSEVTIDDNPTIKYENFNYQGTELGSSVDVSSMDYLHLDLWTADASTVNVFCISPGPEEKGYALPITQGQWVSYDIPLSEFADVVDLTEVFQLKMDGTAGATLFIDNIYFYKGSTAPSELALPLTFEWDNLDYSFTDFDGGEVTVIDNPHPEGINTSDKVGQMIKNAGQTWGGSFITLDNPIDFSAGKTLKMKVFAPRVDAKVLLKVENLTDGGISYEKEVATTVAGSWEELTFDYSGIDDAKTYQKIVLIFDNGTAGDGSADFTFYFDDIALTN